MNILFSNSTRALSLSATNSPHKPECPADVSGGEANSLKAPFGQETLLLVDRICPVSLHIDVCEQKHKLPQGWAAGKAV